MKSRLYSFHSSWDIAAPRQKVWQALTALPFSWQDWWPELRDVHNMRVADGLIGTTFSCSWRAPAGYSLKSDITIAKVVSPKQVTLRSDGDLHGTVICHLHEVGGATSGSTHIEIVWRVRTTKAWMNWLAPLLKPLFIYSHHAVMRSGERGLRKHLQRNHTK
jgi:uncharacterized protein YndB with AHSA1/START domain